MPQNNAFNQGVVLHAAESYPPIQVEGKNLAYAHLLSQNLFAPKGELTAVSQYLYQSWYVFEGESIYAYQEIFADLAKVEMRHMNFLGRLIFLLGLNPCFYTLHNNRPLPWNGTYLQYSVTLQEMLKINIAGESHAIKIYQQTIGQISDPYVTAVLSRICLDEQVHLNVLEQLLQSC